MTNYNKKRLKTDNVFLLIIISFLLFLVGAGMNGLCILVSCINNDISVLSFIELTLFGIIIFVLGRKRKAKLESRENQNIVENENLNS